MANVNRVFLAGNLTRDVAVRFIAGDKAVADFGLAINHKYKASDGTQKEDVTLVDIEAWGRTAELCGQYLAKGRGCFIEGRLKLEQWDDKNGGGKRSKLKVVADSVQFIGGKDKRGETDASDSQPQPQPQPQPARPSAPAAAAASEEPPF